MVKNGPYIFTITEPTIYFSQNFRGSIKLEAAEEFKAKIKTKDKIKDMVESKIKLNILNDPELILFKCSVDKKTTKKFKYVPFEFSLDELVDEEVKCPVGDTRYQIRQIVSCNDQQFFEFANYNLDGTWTGYADGECFGKILTGIYLFSPSKNLIFK